MTVYINVKSLAKRKPLIAGIPFEVTEAVATSDDLVKLTVRKMVRDYNAKPTDAPLLLPLSEDAQTNGTITGKIGFNDRKNEKQQDEDAAVKNALLCFSDGIFRLFVNDNEVGANEPLSLKEGDSVTFIRLTMLTGLLW